MKNLVQPHIRNNFIAHKIYGKYKSQVAHEITSHAHMQDTSTLSAYFLLYATPEHFFKNQHQGSYYRETDQYIIIYSKCTRYQCRNHKGQLKLSFRVAIPEYDLPNYVLVSLGE